MSVRCVQSGTPSSASPEESVAFATRGAMPKAHHTRTRDQFFRVKMTSIDTPRMVRSAAMAYHAPITPPAPAPGWCPGRTEASIDSRASTTASGSRTSSSPRKLTTSGSRVAPAPRRPPDKHHQAAPGVAGRTPRSGQAGAVNAATSGCRGSAPPTNQPAEPVGR